MLHKVTSYKTPLLCQQSCFIERGILQAFSREFALTTRIKASLYSVYSRTGELDTIPSTLQRNVKNRK